MGFRRGPSEARTRAAHRPSAASASQPRAPSRRGSSSPDASVASRWRDRPTGPPPRSSSSGCRRCRRGSLPRWPRCVCGCRSSLAKVPVSRPSSAFGWQRMRWTCWIGPPRFEQQRRRRVPGCRGTASRRMPARRIHAAIRMRVASDLRVGVGVRQQPSCEGTRQERLARPGSRSRRARGAIRGARRGRIPWPRTQRALQPPV